MSQNTKIKYSHLPFVPVVSSSKIAHKYTFTVRDLPKDQKPREKLLKDGPGLLSTPELFAIILNSGTKKEDVLSMSSRIVKEYGEKSILTERNPRRLSENLDIPLIRASQIIAVTELGRRFFQNKKGGAKSIRTAKDVFDYTKNMRDLPKEHLRGIYLNSHYKIIHDELISIGTIDASLVHPREVFRPALEFGASGLILVHNHPSGVLKPSEADINITNQIRDAGRLLGIELIDHVVVGQRGFMSIINKI